jgi:uncharacterized protein (TIGR03000 family)
MVRRWFSITALLAVAVLVIAADASQGQERRLGRRLRNRRGNANVTYVQSNAQESMPADTETGVRRANYPPEPGMSARPRSVLLEVRVPADAEIWIEGTKTLQKGAVRQFVSPPIEPGREYAYKIEVKWMDKGSEHSQSRTLVVHPGERKRVDLTKMAEEKQ